jgi:hypothetical protein
LKFVYFNIWRPLNFTPSLSLPSEINSKKDFFVFEDALEVFSGKIHFSVPENPKMQDNVQNVSDYIVLPFKMIRYLFNKIGFL